MNLDVNVKVTLDLSPLFVEMLWNVLVRVPNARDQDLDERIEAAVKRAVQHPAPDNAAVAAEPAPEPAPSPSVPVQPQAPRDEWTAERRAPSSPVPDGATQLMDARAQPAVHMPPAKDQGPRWTDERHAVLDFYYPAGDALSTILARLNAFDGPVVSYDQMKAKIIYRKLKRADPPAGVTPGSPKPVDLAAETDDATIRHWAGPRGLCNAGEALDLGRINRKRVELGLAAFVRAGATRVVTIGGVT